MRYHFFSNDTTFFKRYRYLKKKKWYRLKKVVSHWKKVISFEKKVVSHWTKNFFFFFDPGIIKS